MRAYTAWKERLMAQMAIHRKSRSFAPEGFFECEAKGLLWLKEAEKVGG